MRIPLIYQIQEVDKEIFKAENDLFTPEWMIFDMYHYRAKLKDKYDWYMTPFKEDHQ